MSALRTMLLPAGIAFAASTAIAVNHDEAYLDHKRSTADGVGPFLREHVLGFMAASALLGAGAAGLRFGHAAAGQRLLGTAAGVVGGIVAGHYGWDAWLRLEEGQA